MEAPMRNHIVIGLGGTGGRSLAALRRRMLGPPNVLGDNGLLVEFLYVDSKDSDCIAAQQRFAEQPPTSIWRSQGHSVALAQRQVVRLEANNFPSVLAMPNDFPAISPWLGDPVLWRKTWDNAPSGVVAGGQMRRFGRYLLAASLPQFDQKFAGALQAVRQKGASTTAAVDTTVVHVIAGLAGGTGSGIFIDVVCRIRALTAGEGHVTVLLYVVPPESGQTPWATSKNYYANGYAALVELNALLVGSFQPFDISGAGRFPPRQPILDNVFVITNQNEDNRVFNVERIIPELIAETIFQTVVLSGDASDSPDARDQAAQQDDAGWRKALTAENIAEAFEADDDNIDEEGHRQGIRANRFLTFGLKRIAVPVDEIRAILSHTFLRALFCQLLYNTWRDGVGYDVGALSSLTAEAKISMQNEEEWGLTEAKLRLDLPSFARDPKEWRPAQQSFSAWIEGVVEPLRKQFADSPRAANPFDPEWVEEIEGIARQRYEEGYRGSDGVEQFYRLWEQEKMPRAAMICQRVEQSLFTDWIAGRSSLQDIGRTIAALNRLIDTKRARLGRETKQLAGEAATAETDRAAARKRLEGMRHGMGRLVTSARSALRELETFGELTSVAYARRARLAAVGYAISLLDEVKLHLLGLRGVIDSLETLLIDAITHCESKVAEIGLDGGEIVGAGLVERLFDQERTAEVILEMKSDRAQQDAACEALRSCLGIKLRLNSFNDILGPHSAYSLSQELLEAAEEQVVIAHRRIADPRKRILTGRILERLYDLYRGQPERLEQKIASWIGQARVFARFDGTERARGERRVEVRRSFVAFVPSAASLPEEKRPVRGSVVAAIRDGFGPGAEIVETLDSEHELTLLTLQYMFPLRMLTLLGELRARFEDALKGPDARARRLEIFLEGNGEQHPLLHMLPRRIAVLPYWLIGEALGLLEEFAPTGGTSQVRFRHRLPDGRTEFVVAGQALSDRSSHIHGAASGLLRLEVTRALRNPAVDRAVIRARLIAMDGEALQHAGGNHQNQTYLEIHGAAGTALSIVDTTAVQAQ